MGTFLGCLFALFIGLILFVWALLNQGLRFIFSLLGIKLPDAMQSAQQRSQRYGERPHQDRQKEQQNYSSSQQSGGENSSSSSKIFKKDESEYVEFEDVP